MLFKILDSAFVLLVSGLSGLSERKFVIRVLNGVIWDKILEFNG